MPPTGFASLTRSLKVGGPAGCASSVEVVLVPVDVSVPVVAVVVAWVAEVTVVLLSSLPPLARISTTIATTMIPPKMPSRAPVDTCYLLSNELRPRSGPGSHDGGQRRAARAEEVARQAE